MKNYRYSYGKQTDLYNQRFYEFSGNYRQDGVLITLDLHKFNQDELNFIHELMMSLDKDNIILANQIILSKYE